MVSSDVFYFVNAILDQDGVEQKYNAGSAVLGYDEFHLQSLNGNEKHQQSTFVPPTTEKGCATLPGLHLGGENAK
jgi:hypothetical protein